MSNKAEFGIWGEWAQLFWGIEASDLRLFYVMHRLSGAWYFLLLELSSD